MKFKFFVTIFFALSFTALSVSSIHYHFFNGERLRLIELNLQQNANLLKSSNLELTKKEFTQEGSEIIDKIIGDDKINMIIGIYNNQGNILYKNDNAYIFNLSDSISPNSQEWEDVEDQEYLIKYLTVKDNDQNRIIRVGMILNQSLIRWKYLNQRIILFVFIILTVVSILSYVLTEMLFRPIGLITRDIKIMASKIESGDFGELKSWFLSRRSDRPVYRDEFRHLLESLDFLAQRIYDGQFQMQKWAALMAHELKTPMTRLKNSVEGYSLKKDQKYLVAIESDLLLLEGVVMDFLAWASLENDQRRQELHAFSIRRRLLSIVEGFTREVHGLVFECDLSEEEDFRVFCNPLHFDQLINNLFTNVMKYSHQKKISMKLKGGELLIKDFGPGIPLSVLENFGKPFNRYCTSGVEGHGLGLAWVKTICKKYNWHLTVSNSLGADVLIRFPFNEQ